MAELISGDALDDALGELDGWSLSADGIAIEKTFTFKGFNAAFGFMTRVAMAAERPTTILNGPTSITVSRSGGPRIHLAAFRIFDVKLARSCDRFAGVLTIVSRQTIQDTIAPRARSRLLPAPNG